MKKIAIIFVIYCIIIGSIIFLMYSVTKTRNANSGRDHITRQNINYVIGGIDSFFSKHHILPDSLDQIIDEDRYYLQSIVEYGSFGYSKLNKTTYKLCAQFYSDYEASSEVTVNRVGIREIQLSDISHHPGLNCYEYDQNTLPAKFVLPPTISE